MIKNGETYLIAFGQKYISGPTDFPASGLEQPEKLFDYAAKFTDKDEALKIAKIMKKAEGKTVNAPVKLIKVTVEEVDLNE